MTLHPPFIISSRLMAALEVGGATLSLDMHDSGLHYEVWIDLPKEGGGWDEHHITDLRPPRMRVQGGPGLIEGGFHALLSFLGAAAESRQYREHTGRPGEHEDLFPPAVVDWASANSDEITMLNIVLEESPTRLIEE